MAFLHNAENLVEGAARLPVQFSENFSNEFANIGNRLAGGKDQTIQQNMGGAPYLNSALNFSQATGTNRQFAGDVAQVGLNAVAPTIGRFSEGMLPSAVTDLSGLGGKIVSGVAKGAAQGTGIGGTQGLAQGLGSNQNVNLGNLTMDFLHGAVSGLAIGGITGGAVPAAQGIKSGLSSATDNVLPRATLHDQQVLQDFVDYRSDAYKPDLSRVNKILSDARDVGQKHGIDLINGTKESQIDAATQILDRIEQQKKQYLETGAVGPNVIKPSGQFSDEDLSKMAVSQSPEQIIKQLEPVTGPIVARRIAPAIVQAHDPHVTANIIDNALNEHLPSPPPATPISDITPVEQLQPAGQGSGLENPDTSESGLGSTAVKPLINSPGTVGQTALSDRMGTNPRGFTTSVQNSTSVSPEVKSLVDGKYNPQSNATLVKKTGTLLDKGLDAATQKVDTSLARPVGSISSQDVSNALTVARAYDASGEVEKAQAIYDRLAQHGTAAGQTIQAFSMLNNRTPEGLKYWVTKTLKKAGVPLEGELGEQLNTAFDVLKQTQEDTPGHGLAVGKIQQLVEKNLPSSATDKGFAVWRAGLLTGPQTVAKIVTSHLINTVLENVKDVPGAAVDKFASMFTGQRSLVASTKGLGSGLQEGVQSGKNLIKTGVDMNPGSNVADVRTSINLGNSVPGKFLQAYVNGVGRIHGALYKPFYGAAHLQSLYNQGLAAAKTQGLKGDESDTFVTQFVHSPSPKALEIAQHDAEMATFQQNTALGNVATALQQKGGIIGKVIAPFTRIPSAIATDLINYSPVGAIKTIKDGIEMSTSKEGWTLEGQRQFSQGLGRSIVGSAAILPGILLYQKGLLTLGYPTDPKEQALWQDEGKQPDSVLIGGQWRKLGSMGPIGSVLSIGGYMADSIVQGQDLGTAALNGLAGGLKSIEGQSYLQGVSSSIDALNSPGSKVTSFVKSTAGSVVPTIANTLANATDSTQRQTTGNSIVQSALNSIKSRTPGLRETLPAKVDAFGNTLKSGETGIERIIDPFQSTTNNTPGPLLQELRRLENSGYGTMPTLVNKKENFGSIKQPLTVNLTQSQVTQLTKMIGQPTEALWAQAVQDPMYNQMSDQQKQASLQNMYSQVAAQEKDIFAQQNKLGPYDPNVLQLQTTSKQKRKQVI